MATSPPPTTTHSPPHITNHILTIPHPAYTHFLTQIVHLSTLTHSTLFVHVGSISASQARSLLHPASDDPDLDAALAAAGRTATPIAGNLTSDFALAMPSSQYPTATPISCTTTTSLAQAMAKRITLKLGLPQLLLSLDIPQPLLPAPNTIQSPADSTALLALEKAIRDACSLTLSQ